MSPADLNDEHRAPRSAVDQARSLFGPFDLRPTQQLLLRGEVPVRLCGRALDILALLVEQAGEVVGKDALVARAWPRRIVDESNLKVTIASIRKALGQGRSRLNSNCIATVNSLGYRFVAPVQNTMLKDIALGQRHNLPSDMRLIGRDDEQAAVAAQLRDRPIVTITGPGGVGKTTLAVAVAHQARVNFPDGTWFLDLSAVHDGRYLADTLAHQIGLTLLCHDAQAGLLAAIKSWRTLVILDCCEYALDEAAQLADAVARTAPYARLLVTSR